MKPLEQLEVVNRICDHFESEWQSGKVSDISSFERWYQNELAENSSGISSESTRKDSSKGSLADSKLGKQILFELLMLDLHYRQQESLDEMARQYQAAFATQADVVKSALVQFNRARGSESAKAPAQKGSTVVESSPEATRGMEVLSGHGVTNSATDSLGFEMAINHLGFEVVRRHAQGGLGIVSVARDASFPREVALKEIRPDRKISAEMRDRFIFEGRITGQLEHPGIVPVYSLGINRSGQPFYAMRLIQGRSLRTVIENFFDGHQTRSRFETHRWWKQHLGRLAAVCDAVEYAHKQEVIHRDIKPSNIMIGDYGETLLVDWGLAKRMNEGHDADVEATYQLDSDSGSNPSRTREGRVIGTVSYMSPEQAKGKNRDIGKPADVYCLGSTLYALLTGKAPYSGDKSQLMERVQHNDFSLPRRVNRNVPPALQAICLKAMNPSPGDRYETAAALGTDLRNWMADEPISAWREPILSRLGRLGRRHRSLVALAAVFLMLATIGSLIFSQLLVGKNREITKQNEEIKSNNEEITDLLQKTRLANYQFLRFAGDETRVNDQAFRTRSMNNIVANHKQLVALYPDDDELAREYALGLKISGDMHAQQGNHELAARDLGKANEVLSELVEKSSMEEKEDLYRQYCGVLMSQSELSAMVDDPQQTESKVRECLRRLKELSDVGLDTFSTRWIYGMATYRLGGELSRQARFEESVEQYKASRKTFSGLSTNVDNTATQRRDAEVFYYQSWTRYAAGLAYAGSRQESGKEFDEAIREGEAWLQQRPNPNSKYVMSLMFADYAISMLMVREPLEGSLAIKLNNNQLEEIEQRLNKGIELARDNLAQLNQVETYHLVLIKCQLAKTRILRMQGKTGEAFAQSIRTAIRIAQFEEDGIFSKRTNRSYLCRNLLTQVAMIENQRQNFVLLNRQPSRPAIWISSRMLVPMSAITISMPGLLEKQRDERFAKLETAIADSERETPNSYSVKKFREQATNLKSQF